jgi:hypothetical protein
LVSPICRAYIQISPCWPLKAASLPGLKANKAGANKELSLPTLWLKEDAKVTQQVLGSLLFASPSGPHASLLQEAVPLVRTMYTPGGRGAMAFPLFHLYAPAMQA